jgi:hypothetical protein
MNFRHILISTFLLFVFCQVQAQKSVVPGYQGKKITLELNQHFTPAVFSFTPKHKSTGFDVTGTEDQTSLLAFNFQTNLNATYTISRKMALLLEYGLGKTGFESSSVQLKSSFGNNNDGFYEAKYNHMALGFLVCGKKSWGLSPIGPYWGLKFMRTQAKSTLKELRIEASNYEWEDRSKFEDIITDAGDEEDISFYNVGLMFGSKKVIFNKAILNLGATFCYRGFLPIEAGFFDAETQMLRSVARNYMAFFHLGIGIIL